MWLLIQSCVCLALLGLGGRPIQAVEPNIEGKTVLEYYYSVYNDLDGDFIVSQLIPEVQNRTQDDLEMVVWPYGGLQIISDENGTFYCHGRGVSCETSLIHFCIEWTQNGSILVPFLECYFQSEYYPMDPIGASEECLTRMSDQDHWKEVMACTKHVDMIRYFVQDAQNTHSLRPVFEQTPRIFINGFYSALGAIDLRKAFCRENTTDIWQCESKSQFKEPVVEIFYMVAEQETVDFFTTQLYPSVALKVLDTTARLVLVPNPNQVFECFHNDSSTCWAHLAHWCIYQENNDNDVRHLDVIRCALEQSSSVSSLENRLKQCITVNEYQKIEQCIDSLQSTNSSLPSVISTFQTQLNLQVEPSVQQAIEVTINRRSNVKVRGNGLLHELCYNYMHVDNETVGCAVTRPKVQVFYEAHSESIAATFVHILEMAPFAPFETVAQFEFVPYGRTSFVNGEYHCPLGPEQCHANWLHACLLRTHYSTVQEQFWFMQFFICTAVFNATTSPLEHAVACASQVYADFGPNLWPLLQECVANDTDIREQLRNKTEAIELVHIPEIVIDGVVSTAEVGQHLLISLCRSVEPGAIRPRVCSKLDRASSQTPIQVTVFLSGDHDSQEFVRSHLKPILTDGARDASLRLRDVTEWHFVPWATSVYNETSGEIQCASGGANECLANRVLACATRQRQNGRLGNREDRQRLLAFVVCFFDAPHWRTNPLDAANQCSSDLSPLDCYPQLWQCAVQLEQTRLMLDMKHQTENNYPAFDSFPQVTINAQRLNTGDNFIKDLCSYYKARPVPGECNMFTSAPATVTIPTTIVSETVTNSTDSSTTNLTTTVTISTTIVSEPVANLTTTTPEPENMASRNQLEVVFILAAICCYIALYRHKP